MGPSGGAPSGSLLVYWAIGLLVYWSIDQTGYGKCLTTQKHAGFGAA
jgi:hypothetical protein